MPPNFNIVAWNLSFRVDGSFKLTPWASTLNEEIVEIA